MPRRDLVGPSRQVCVSTGLPLRVSPRDRRVRDLNPCTTRNPSIGEVRVLSSGLGVVRPSMGSLPHSRTPASLALLFGVSPWAHQTHFSSSSFGTGVLRRLVLRSDPGPPQGPDPEPPTGLDGQVQKWTSRMESGRPVETKSRKQKVRWSLRDPS
ncbi:Hypothetical predicted protein [Marmota monax]|uniref:Uncharacterized protein n=1 Tax=Marmota monax TaxID=9995 RepID=A0A5E4CQH8_MARMO|nr:Hypothetical predicted protein [Marmota monax]